MHLLSFSFILPLPDGQCVKLRKFLRCAQSTVHKYIKTALTGGFLHDFSAALNGADIFLDYAHTPDGLKTTLNSMRRICEGKLYCLFGCGGNREKEKRSVMGEISGVIADFTIITSDNPRYEDPCLIISEIEKGIRRVTRNYVTVSDRKSALVYAISLLKDGDVLVVAGKGAENYQEIMGVKRDFSDEAEIRSAIARIEGENS